MDGSNEASHDGIVSEFDTKHVTSMFMNATLKERQVMVATWDPQLGSAGEQCQRVILPKPLSTG